MIPEELGAQIGDIGIERERLRIAYMVKALGHTVTEDAIRQADQASLNRIPNDLNTMEAALYYLSDPGVEETVVDDADDSFTDIYNEIIGPLGDYELVSCNAHGIILATISDTTTGDAFAESVVLEYARNAEGEFELAKNRIVVGGDEQGATPLPIDESDEAMIIDVIEKIKTANEVFLERMSTLSG